jgi:hypothetical protein
MDFDDLCLNNLEAHGEIVLAELAEAEQARESAVRDASVFIFKVRDLADIAPLPPIFYRVVSRLSGLKFEDA